MLKQLALKVLMYKNKNLFGSQDMTSSKQYEEVIEPVVVKCKIIFSRMGTINTINECFDCQAYVECAWEDDNLFHYILNLNRNIQSSNKSQFDIYKHAIDNLKYFEYNPDKHWSPKIYIENTIGDLKEEKTYKFEIIEKIKPSCSIATTISVLSNEYEKVIDCLTDLDSLERPIQPNYTVRVSEMNFVKGVFYEV